MAHMPEDFLAKYVFPQYHHEVGWIPGLKGFGKEGKDSLLHQFFSSPFCGGYVSRNGESFNDYWPEEHGEI